MLQTQNSKIRSVTERIRQLMNRYIFGVFCIGVVVMLDSNAYAANRDNGQCRFLNLDPRGVILHSTDVCLGIHFDAGMSSTDLNEREKKEWADYVDLSVPDVIPPYPLPNPRALLNNFHVFEGAQKQEQTLDKEPLARINVHIDEYGKVNKMEVLINNAEIESALFLDAISRTRFTPAFKKDVPVPSSIILELHRLFRFAERE